MRGHSHSVTRVAIECGSSSRVTAQQLLAHQLGHPERLGHVGDHVVGVVLRALGQPGDEVRRRARRRPRRSWPTPGSTRDSPSSAAAPSCAEHLLASTPCRPCSRRTIASVGHAVGRRTGRRGPTGCGGVEHEARRRRRRRSAPAAVSLSRSPSSGAGLVDARACRRTRSGASGPVEHAPDLGAGGLRLVGDDRDLGAEDAGSAASTCPTLGRPTNVTKPGAHQASLGLGRRRLDGVQPVRSGPGRCGGPATCSARELPAVDLDRLALGGHVAERSEQEAADGVPVVLGQLDVEQLVDLVDRHAAVDPVRRRRAAARPRAPRRRTRRRSRRRAPRCRSSSVTSPAVPPYSSTTIAMWNFSACISRSSSADPLGLGTKRAGRSELARPAASPWPSRSARIRSLV